jgi:3-hydroxyisobutyrate dehydrogenase-like beta-hydroxyacid dehydrogenase
MAAQQQLARISILGVGKMGAASARRLAGLGYDVRVWNRSQDKAEALAQTTPSITVAETARDAVETADLCIALLSTTDAVKAVVEECRGLAFDAVLANLASGSPDDGRAVAAAVAEALPNATYVDGAYCGPPSALEQGTGQLFASCAGGEAALDTSTSAALRALGVTTFCEGVGAARALDYAVVDMAFVTLMSYASNAAMLEAEGVSTDVAIAAISHRLAAAPAALSNASARMAARDYEKDPTATLATWRNFFDSRRPYLERIGASQILPDFCIDVLDRAGANDADVTRIQEVLRYPS